MARPGVTFSWRCRRSSSSSSRRWPSWACGARTRASCRARWSGRPAPEIAAHGGAARRSAADATADLRAPGVKLVNFWASWCGPCRVEHPLLTALAAEGIPVIGINYKDTPDEGARFLDELGDPYAKIGADATGRTGLDWGIYGVPETFVVGPDGTILLRFPGPLSPDVVEKRIRPAIAAAE